jgi:MFS family permease
VPPTLPPTLPASLVLLEPKGVYFQPVAPVAVVIHALAGLKLEKHATMIPEPKQSKAKERSRHVKRARSDSHAKPDLGHLEHAAPEVVYTPETDDPPNGGAVAWLQVFGSHLMNALAWGYAAAYGVYQLHYTETMDLPRAQVSSIGSIQIFLTSAICTFSGRLTDAGYARESAIVGSAMAVFGTFMTSLAKTYWQILLAQGVCTGLGLGLLFIPAITVASTYFTTKRSFAMSIAAMGTGTGSVVFPATVQYLIPKVGFPWAVRCLAFVMLAFAVAGVALLKPRLPPRKSGPWVEWGAFKEVPYLLFAAGMFLLFWALYFGFFYVSEATQLSLRRVAHLGI